MIGHAPLLHPQILRGQRERFAFPDDLPQRYQAFLPLLAEARLHPDPLTNLQVIHELFCEVLGYRSPFQVNDLWEIDFTDRMTLGYFTTNKAEPIAEIFAGTTFPSLNFGPGIEWLIVTDFYQISLYHKGYTLHFCERLDFKQFDDLTTLEAFYFLFCRRNFLAHPLSRSSARVSIFLEESLQLEQEQMREFYGYLHRLQLQLTKDLQYRLGAIPSLPLPIPVLAENTAQKLIYRLLYLGVGSSRGILPPGLLQDAYGFVNPYGAQPVWSNFRAVFRWIELGNSAQNMPANPIDFFQEDEILDQLIHIGDELCRQMKEIERIDFREEISLLMLVICLGNLSQRSATSGGRKLNRWRFSKQLLASQETWKLLVAQFNQNEAETSGAFWLEKWQWLHRLKLFDPECRLGMRLFVAFDFLEAAYATVYRKLTATEEQMITLPSTSQLLSQILGLDRDAPTIAMVKLIFYLYLGCYQPLLIESGPLEGASFKAVIDQAAAEQCLVYLS